MPTQRFASSFCWWRSAIKVGSVRRREAIMWSTHPQRGCSLRQEQWQWARSCAEHSTLKHDDGPDEIFKTLVTGLWMAITTPLLDLSPTSRPIYLWRFCQESGARVVRESKNAFLRALCRITEILEWCRANAIDNVTEPDSDYFAAARVCGVNGTTEVFGFLDDVGQAYVLFKSFSGHVEGDMEKAAIYTRERATRLAKHTQDIVLIVGCTKKGGLVVPLKRASSIARGYSCVNTQSRWGKALVVGSTFRQRLAYYMFVSVLPRTERKKVLFHHTNVWGSINWKVSPYKLNQGVVSEAGTTRSRSTWLIIWTNGRGKRTSVRC